MKKHGENQRRARGSRQKAPQVITRVTSCWQFINARKGERNCDKIPVKTVQPYTLLEKSKQRKHDKSVRGTDKIEQEFSLVHAPVRNFASLVNAACSRERDRRGLFQTEPAGCIPIFDGTGPANDRPMYIVVLIFLVEVSDIRGQNRWFDVPFWVE